MKKAIYVCAVVLFLGIFGFSAWKLLQIGAEYRRGEKEYARLSQYVVIPETTQKPTQPKEATEPAQEQPTEAPQPADEILWPQVDFDALQLLNPDVVGWIYIPDTDVNYPIVQGSDNDQYLYRLISGEYNSAGSIFLDAKASSLFMSRNNPIYGHNMKNGAMFADVTGYKDQKFYDEHPVALLLTPQKNYKVNIFSAYTTDAWGDSWQIGFDDVTYADWLQRLWQRSFVTAAVEPPTTADLILTFSTCTYETADARFVVHGILEEQTEE